ncbi:hypothetical protein CCR85_01250 [Rhodothalassium salexigens]|uniref:phage head-tail joining protein n=1 Tax=Rhodothalassium salexigens TaxID=1086 RepID=UPI0019132373|nr:hypothetical protein [Rhodothalassium salexigens]MBK5910119.1 hypothetical protein [Rhodothalassium salexigens]MBK5920732.1 hypothetical protein [Rhodothalassium salexigens]
MVSIETLRARLDALEAAMAEGVSEVRFGDRRVVYRSYDDMRRAAGDLSRRIAEAEGRARRPSRLLTRTRKGL